jgi:hypothetical protein
MIESFSIERYRRQSPLYLRHFLRAQSGDWCLSPIHLACEKSEVQDKLCQARFYVFPFFAFPFFATSLFLQTTCFPQLYRSF